MNYRHLAVALIFLLSTSLFSCRNSQELVYMQDTSNQEILEALPDSVTEYQVKPGDILYVSIKSMNAEVNNIKLKGYGYSYSYKYAYAEWYYAELKSEKDMLVC